MSRLKALVVDDSAFSRQTIRKMLEGSPDIDVVGTATDGIDAISKTIRLKPDLITLDLEMPEMDGFAFLRWVMIQRPVPVIIVSSHGDRVTVFRALEMGAVDFVSKPTRGASAELKNIERDLLSKVYAIRDLDMNALSRNIKLLEPPPPPVENPSESEIELVAVGASTGGPAALQIILTRLPAEFPAAIVVSQHMPRGFTGPLAERLDKLCNLRVKEAREADEPEPGTTLICPAGFHMQFKGKSGKAKVVLTEGSFEDRYTPSVDVMMQSAAQTYGGRAMGVLLTGMGNDGKRGMLEIKSKGGYTIAESKETAVVFGMPQEAIKAGAALKVLPLTEISGEILRAVKYGK
jgi:two-component system chemotaxis response regulator CheB